MKKRKICKTLAVLFGVFMLTAMFSPLAASAQTLSTSTAVQPLETQTKEMIVLREEFVKHFELPDGTGAAVVYDSPVHYEKDGAWVEIDNTLVGATKMGNDINAAIVRNDKMTAVTDAAEADAKGVVTTAYYENNDNPFKVQLPATIDRSAPIAVTHGEHTLRFCFDGAVGTASATLEQPFTTAEKNAQLRKALSAATDEQEKLTADKEHAMTVWKNRSAVTFASVQPNVDLQYHVSGKKLKETLVFQQVPTALSFSFTFTYTGLQAVLQKDNSVHFLDDTGTVAFIVAAPYMFDNGEGYSTDITVTLQETATGCRYTLTPDRAWLTDVKRVYPVTLDPTVNRPQNSSYMQDAGVQQSNPNDDYQGLDRIYVGSGPNRTQGVMFFKLLQWPENADITVGNIIKAELRLAYYPTASWQTGHNFTIQVWKLNTPWSHDDFTWNDSLNVFGQHISGSDKPIADARQKTSGYDTYDVTVWARAHYEQPTTEHGIRLQPATVSSSINRVCYASTEYSQTTERPLFFIEYITGSGPVAGLSNNQTYYLRNVNSGKYLHVPGGDLTHGTDVVQYDLQGTTNQQFKLVYNSATRDYSLSPICAPNMGVEITNGSSANNAVVQIGEKLSTGFVSAQRFNIVKNSDGSYRLLSYSSAHTKAVVVEYASLDNSAAIIQYDNNGSTNGFWFFELANKTITTNANASANSGYNREAAALYAEDYAEIPNSTYEDLTDNNGDCTNFVSQCLRAGGMPMTPSGAAWGAVSKTLDENWFYLQGFLAEDWVSYSFTSASYFYAHWGQTNHRAYQTVQYDSGADAIADIDFLIRYLEKGDVIQLMSEYGTVYHSMIIYDDDESCDGNHYGNAGACSHQGKKEILYAQHTPNTMQGHLRTLLEDYEDQKIIFIKIKK